MPQVKIEYDCSPLSKDEQYAASLGRNPKRAPKLRMVRLDGIEFGSKQYVSRDFEHNVPIPAGQAQILGALIGKRIKSITLEFEE